MIIVKIYLEKLTLIREAEIKIAKERKSGVIGCPVHLSAGQEAIPIANFRTSFKI